MSFVLLKIWLDSGCGKKFFLREVVVLIILQEAIANHYTVVFEALWQIASSISCYKKFG